MQDGDGGRQKMNVIGTEVEYFLFVKGIFGRNRSVKKKSFTLATIPEGDAHPSAAECAELAKAKLAEIKAKPGTQYAVNFRKYNLEQFNSGGAVYTVKSYTMFQDTGMILKDEVRQ
jgi:hypothetical protein